MTSATTLYGVTMEESGVSKKVAVKFEEVGEDGEILVPSPSETSRRAA
jgi:chromosome segregation protein